MKWQGIILALLCWIGAVFPALANKLENIRAWPAPTETRVVMDLADKPAYSFFTLTSPNRLVVDLKQTGLGISLPMAVEKSKILKRIRKSNPPEAGTYRLVFELSGKSKPRLFTLAPGGEYGHRLVIDLPHPGNDNDVVKPVKRSSTSATTALPFGTDDIVIAVDAGHGGNDPGAIGPKRNFEKHVTLAIAKQVAAKINNVPGMRAVLTRTGDYFVDLNKRSRIARQHKAHLLVSIHADGFHKPDPKGASVWLLSQRRANNEIGRWLEQTEEQSNLLGGGSLLGDGNEDEYLSRAVLDLQFANSQKEGYDVAVRVLSKLGRITSLHKSNPEHASLAVLKSPDIPSLLVEAGFITNPKEEKLLTSKRHQSRVADAVSDGIISYFQQFPPDGTLLAVKKNGVKHTVKSGESLSVIAKRFGTTVASIRAANGLKSSTLRIGQLLTVPGVNVDALVKAGTAEKRRTTTVSASNTRTTTLTHTVRQGEFLGKIAAKYGVTVSSIRKNNALKRDVLYVGKKLKIVGAKVSSTATNRTRHKVKRGEYLGQIAASYGVTIQSIRKANKLRSDELAIGQTLIIPRS
ncbi:LysM peptidoglycan-binding domain-containing protein [Veronia pacifica]|uniref:N-acetylmuramoyl-L-alanine amidase n=1 Tax=Veronia pacifica TaxID=1080227 RepID=A0A1C3ED61_9GAMM|nr:LysM peptidoglycan-binding domain-containing protein [Veronia pacifica]ODA31165.1 N-acetylmuramoyl-L-alanine amidase [Veronia pacifica]